MATIEPRLIHLLNESTTPQLSNNDLPPLHSLLLPDSPDRPLPPLDLEGTLRVDRHYGRQAPPGGPSCGASSAPLHTHPSDEPSFAAAASRKDDDRRAATDARYAGGAALPYYPMGLLLGEGDVAAAAAAAAAAAITSATATGIPSAATATATSTVTMTVTSSSSITPTSSNTTTTVPNAAAAAGTAATTTAAAAAAAPATATASASASESASASASASATEQPHSFANILDDGFDSPDDAYTKKRGRALNVKDDFVQLPQPVKKQKAAQQAPVMPPIINGLLEPPPHAALFPPMSSGSFDDDVEANQMRLLHDFNHGIPEEKSCQKPRSESDHGGGGGSGGSGGSAGAGAGAGAGEGGAGGGGNGGGGSSRFRKRASKPRRKWSNEETNHLLLGVNRHGVGKWTSILEDPAFKFNERTAGDLKDRFRTCCPEELRGNAREHNHDSRLSSRQKAKKGLYFENILIDDDELSSVEPATSPNNDSDSAPKKKSRAHRKKMEDLAQLGIHGPFKKSHRRERRPFTEQDDREILVGLETYGPAWTKIQRDPRFHLSSRQPTDLRDRVRNKYPIIYQRIEKGAFQVANESRSNAILEPSINMMIDDSFKAPNKAGLASNQFAIHGGSREELPRWPFQMLETPETVHPQQQQQQQPTFDFSEHCAPPVIGGEMDISRLLLDDSRVSQGSTRFGFDENSAASSPMDAAHDCSRNK